jgi:hypothetical protein
MQEEVDGLKGKMKDLKALLYVSRPTASHSTGTASHSIGTASAWNGDCIVLYLPSITQLTSLRYAKFGNTINLETADDE